MKKDVKSLVENFQATAKAVKLRLQKSGFVVPVAHKGGIKFLHIWIRKNNQGFYDVVNLHNPKTVYAKGISNHKLAVAVGIMYGKNAEVDMMYITKVDHEYWHHMSNIIQYRYSSEMALKNGDETKSEIVLSRADYHLDALQPIKRQVNSILNDAEKLLFDNK